MNVTKHLPKFLLLFLLLVFTNCQEEEITESNIESFIDNIGNVDQTLKITTIDVKDVPSLGKFLDSKMPKSNTKSNDSGNYIETAFGNIPLEDVMQVIDTLGNTNHTFRIIPNIWKPNNFYNLIVHNNPDLSEPISYVLHYELDTDYAQALSQESLDY